MALEPGKFELNEVSHKQIVRNLLKRTRELTPESVKAGKDFYPSGQKDAIHLGAQFGGGALGGAAILAKLSGSTDWHVNRLQGMQIPTVSDHSTKLIHRAATIGTEMRAEGRSQADITGETRALRARAGLPGTPLNFAGSREASAALKVRDNEASPLEIFNSKAHSKKTPDFRDTLATGGNHPAAVIDTHAYDAAMDSYHVPYGVGNDHLAKAGTYDFVQRAYADAHHAAIKKNLIPESTSLSDFQAMHWVHHINTKAQVNSGANKSAKGAITKIANLIKDNPHLAPETKGLDPIILTRQPHLAAFNEGAGR